MGWLAWLFGWSDLTALESVRVSGADGLVAEAVLDAADPPLGVQLIRVDTDAVADRVRTVADVEAASVHRSWLRSLTIEVTERVPAAALDDDGAWWQIDESGVLFGESATPPADLPVLVAPADASESAMAARAAGVAVLAGLPDDLLELVETVSAPTEASVELTLADGVTVRWGTADDSEHKADVLVALLAAEEGSGYDVSAPDSPAVRP
jgi:cell division protein FtsQ